MVQGAQADKSGTSNSDAVTANSNHTDNGKILLQRKFMQVSEGNVGDEQSHEGGEPYPQDSTETQTTKEDGEITKDARNKPWWKQLEEKNV